MDNQRYRDYHLIDNNMDDEINLFQPEKKCNVRRSLCIFGIVSIVIIFVSFVGVFVAFPLAFKYSLTLQQTLVFTRFNLNTNSTIFQYYRYPEFRNLYVPVKDHNSTLKLGLWHLLPTSLAEKSIYDPTYDFDSALKRSNISVLLYFHGTGEDRSQNLRKYQLLRQFFHVIVFDYRGYGDSNGGQMLEENVVNDCVQVYEWLRGRTEADVFFWGHSLGTSLAARTLTEVNGVKGIILEASFTSFEEELYHHPYTKYFKWLPWFRSTVIEPLHQNGFIFNTSHYVSQIKCAILFFHAQDDHIVPFFMSEKLYDIAQQRQVPESVYNSTELVVFDGRLRLNHYFIYQDPYVFFYVFDFLGRVQGSDQS